PTIQFRVYRGRGRRTIARKNSCRSCTGTQFRLRFVARKAAISTRHAASCDYKQSAKSSRPRDRKIVGRLPARMLGVHGAERLGRQRHKRAGNRPNERERMSQTSYKCKILCTRREADV